MYEPFFRRVELAAELPMTRGGRPFRRVRVYRCEGQRVPCPYTYEAIRAATAPPP